jgi:hypothetical protein
MELAFRLSRKLALRVEYHPEVVSQLVRGPEFAGMFRRLYREGRSLRRFFEQQGEAAFTILPPEFRNCAEFAAKLEPKLPVLLEIIRQLETTGCRATVSINLDGRALTGVEALKAAYSICVRFSRSRGWLEFASRVAESAGLERIDQILLPYHGAAVAATAQPTANSLSPQPPAKRVLAYFHSNLYPPRSGAHRRCLSLLIGLKNLGYDVTLMSSDLFTDQAWSDESIIGLERDLGIRAKIYRATAADREHVVRTQAHSRLWGTQTPPGLVAAFRAAARELAPEVVLVNYAYCAELADAPELANATRIVEMHDLVSLSGAMASAAWAQLGTAPFGLGSVAPAFLDEKFNTRLGLQVDPEEFRRYARFDLVTAISNLEADQVRAAVPGANVSWLPMALDAVPLDNTYSGPPAFVIFTNPFNLQGYLYFAEKNPAEGPPRDSQLHAARRR